MTVRAIVKEYAVAIAAIAISGVAVCSAHAAESVGEAKTVVNKVTGNSGGSTRPLKSADPVFAAEAISADEQSRGELLLRDGSKVIVGEGSIIHMDDFVVAGDGFAEGTINVAKGAFRFISGGSKENIRIKTPLSTIGIRGTALDVYVDDAGVTRVVLLSGAITTCTDGQCVNSDRPCDIVEVTAPGAIQELPFLRSAGRRRGDEAEQFDLTERQQRHTRDWRAPTVACSARAADEAQSPNPSANPTGNTGGRGAPAGNGPDGGPGKGGGESEGFSGIN